MAAGPAGTAAGARLPPANTSARLPPAAASHSSHIPGSPPHMKTDKTPCHEPAPRSPSITWARNCMGPAQARQAGQLNPAGTSGIPPIRVTRASPATAPAYTMSAAMAAESRTGDTGSTPPDQAPHDLPATARRSSQILPFWTTQPTGTQAPATAQIGGSARVISGRFRCSAWCHKWGSACRDWLRAEGLGFGAGCPGAGPARLDASPADPGRRDAHVHVAGAARPRLEARPILKAPHFTLAGDRVRVTVHQDAPAFTVRLVEVAGFEADLPVGVHGQQRVRCGAEDDGLPVTAKLTGSILIPSADANPTRPMPPASSRPRHSAGPSVRRARS